MWNECECGCLSFSDLALDHGARELCASRAECQSEAIGLADAQDVEDC